jgi:hypothetical protein
LPPWHNSHDDQEFTGFVGHGNYVSSIAVDCNADYVIR